jgi:hypothetical protein
MALSRRLLAEDKGHHDETFRGQFSLWEVVVDGKSAELRRRATDPHPSAKTPFDASKRFGIHE